MRQLGLLVVVLAFFQSFGALAQDSVPEAAIVLYLAQAYNNPGQFEITALKQFPNGTTGTGRVSFAGTLTFAHATYVKTYGLQDALRAEGFSDQEITYYGADLGYGSPVGGFYLTVYDLEHKAADVVSFTADYQYRKTASGFDFWFNSGTLQIYGVPLEDIPKKRTMLAGSTDFERVMSDFRKAKSVRQALIDAEEAELEGFLAGTTLYAAMPVDYSEDPLRWSDRFQIVTEAKMRWKETTPGLLHFEILGNAEFLLPAEWYDTDYVPGDRLPVQIFGGINLEDHSRVSFQVAIPDSRGNGGFMTNGFSFLRETIDGHEAFVSGAIRLSQAHTIPGPPRKKLVWKVASTNNMRKALFELRQNQCLAVETEGGKRLKFLDDADMPESTAVIMPPNFVVAGPKKKAGLWFDSLMMVTFRYRVFDKTNGACEIG